MIFAVDPDICNVLNVTVLEAHGVTKGWVKDLMDTPDPYVILKVPGSPNGEKKTKHCDNTSSPAWNENFRFILNANVNYELEITLMDSNYTFDEKLGFEKINLEDLVLDEEKIIMVEFEQVTVVSLKLFLVSDHRPDLRYGLSLCDQEQEFRKHRLRNIAPILEEMFLLENSIDEKDIPIISVIGSGGGFRAMIALGGAIKALSDTKILDCIMYVAGLSGSAWYLSTLYSHPEFPSKSPGELIEDVKANVRHSPFWLLSPRSMYRYISKIKEKYKIGQPVSFTDFFGHLLGDTLLKGRSQALLSEQKEKLVLGKIPMPLYACLHVKNNVSAKVFQDWLEFTPYEIGLSKYATFMKAEHFGSKFYKGYVVKRFPEFPLHYLQGVWGSAFCILFKRLIQDPTKLSMKFDTNDETESDDEEVFFDAEEEFQIEEDNLRSELENLDFTSSHIDDVLSENEEAIVEEKPEKRENSGGIWKDFINSICANSVLDTRRGRAGCILNPLRGLKFVPCFEFSPFSPTSPSDETLFKGLTEPARTDSKTLFLVDGGLTFNLPFPLLLRSERKVDIFLTFDFSSRSDDITAPFKELLITEKWAKINNCLFPPIYDLASEFIKHSPKECYVFKHPTDSTCPIIIHFPLINLDFKLFKAPGVPRGNEEELKFGNFEIFSGHKKAYSIYNFKYPNKKFDRLAQLMEFNVLNNINIIRENILSVIKKNKPLSENAYFTLSHNFKNPKNQAKQYMSF